MLNNSVFLQACLLPIISGVLRDTAARAVCPSFFLSSCFVSWFFCFIVVLESLPQVSKVWCLAWGGNVRERRQRLNQSLPVRRRSHTAIATVNNKAKDKES